MPTSKSKPDPGANGPGMLHEADVGSGERSPAQHETDRMIQDIPQRGNRQDDGGSGHRQGEPAQPAKP